MKEQWAKLKEWWLKASVRERRAVMAGALIGGLFIVYQGLWMPYLDTVSTLRQRISTAQKTLVWMQAADKEMRKLENQAQHKSKTISPVELLSLLQKQITEAGLDGKLTQLKQAENDSVEMHFQSVSFDKVSQLLILISKENNVAISQMSVVSVNTPGLVNTDITLQIH